MADSSSAYNPEVLAKFNRYPSNVKPKLERLRTLIFETAKENQLGPLKESLKWGEPSYHTKNGSPIRLDWKESKPDQYALYFNCKTQLIDTFREIYGKELNFEGNRAIVFDLREPLPKRIIKHCIKLALTYHKVKHLPLLGA